MKYKAVFVKDKNYTYKNMTLSEKEMKRLVKLDCKGFLELDNGNYINAADFVSAKPIK